MSVPANVRPNWRHIPVVDLTDEEVAQMSKQDVTWCLDLLAERARRRSPPEAVPAKGEGDGA